MFEEIKIQDNDKYANWIGALLLLPLYFPIMILLGPVINGYWLYITLVYSPIIIGMILSYKNYYNRASKTLTIIALFFLLIGSLFYRNAYFVESDGWDGLGNYLLWLINVGIARLLLCIFYGKIFGLRKMFIFVVIYICSLFVVWSY